MPLDQEQIISLASVVDKLKDDNLKLSKSFNSSPPGKGRVKGKVKYKVGIINYLANSPNVEN